MLAVGDAAGLNFERVKPPRAPPVPAIKAGLRSKFICGESLDSGESAVCFAYATVLVLLPRWAAEARLSVLSLVLPSVGKTTNSSPVLHISVKEAGATMKVICCERYDFGYPPACRVYRATLVFSPQQP